MNGRGCLPPGVWIHLPLGDLGHMVWKGVRRRLRLVLAWGHASAWFSPFWRGPAPGGQSTQAYRQYSLPNDVLLPLIVTELYFLTVAPSALSANIVA